jgi:hypothetical protein
MSLLLPVLLWMVKVPLANWAMRRLPGDWAVTVTGIRPGFSGATLTGVRVLHRPTGRQLGFAEEVEAANGWSRLLKGELGALTLTRAEVSWREEFEVPYVLPPEGGPQPTTLVAWDSGKVNGGVFTWYEAGREVPRLALKIVRFEGGRFSIYSDGRVEAAPQHIGLEEVVSREFALDGALEVESRSPAMEGVATAQRQWNRYTVEEVRVQAPQCRVTWHRDGALTPPPSLSGSEPGPTRPAWDLPAQIFVRQGRAEPGTVSLDLHTASTAAGFEAALASLEVKDVRFLGGLPFVFGESKAILEEVKSAATTLDVKRLDAAVRLDEQQNWHVSNAVISDLTLKDSRRFLPVLGFSEEEIKPLVTCSGGLDARLDGLVIGPSGISSPELQHLTLREFTAVLPDEKDPIARAKTADIAARPEEALGHKHLRSVMVEQANVRVSENVFTDELNPLSTVPAHTPDPSSHPPRWYGWHTDSLIVHQGRVRGVDLGIGIPNAVGDFTVETSPREAGGENLYRIHIRNIALTNPLLAGIKVDSVMDLDVHPRRVWETEAVDEVRVNGVKVEFHEAFLKLFEAVAPPSGAAPREAGRE